MPYPKRTVRAVCLLPLLLCVTTLTMACPLPAQALAKPLQTSSQSIQQAHIATPNSQSSLYTSRLALYRSVEALTGIPWYRLAAIDQYERTLTIAHPKDRKHAERVTGIFVTGPVWSGLMNPDPEDRHPRSISFFPGWGRTDRVTELLTEMMTGTCCSASPLISVNMEAQRMSFPLQYGNITTTAVPFKGYSSSPNCIEHMESWS